MDGEHFQCLCSLPHLDPLTNDAQVLNVTLGSFFVSMVLQAFLKKKCTTCTSRARQMPDSQKNFGGIVAKAALRQHCNASFMHLTS